MRYAWQSSPTLHFARYPRVSGSCGLSFKALFPQRLSSLIRGLEQSRLWEFVRYPAVRLTFLPAGDSSFLLFFDCVRRAPVRPPTPSDCRDKRARNPAARPPSQPLRQRPRRRPGGRAESHAGSSNHRLLEKVFKTLPALLDTTSQPRLLDTVCSRQHRFRSRP